MGHDVIVHLIRHEKTKANVEKKYLGWTNEPIILPKEKFTIKIAPKKVFGSDLKRCEQTSRYYFPSAEYIPCKDLRELNFGDFEMKTYEELKNDGTYRHWIESPESITPPNGENFIHFQERVVKGFNKIIHGPGEYTLIVHGGVIRLLLSQFGQVFNSFQQVTANHRTIYTLKWSQLSGLKGGGRCELLSVEPLMEREGL